MAGATPESGIAGPGNPSGAILPITGNQGTTPTAAQSGANSNPQSVSPTLPNYNPGAGNVVPVSYNAPAASPAAAPGAVSPVTGASTSAPYGTNPATGVPYGSPGSNNANPNGSGPKDQYGNPLSEEDAYTQELNQAQGEIASITGYYNNLLQQDTVQNSKDTDATRAMNLSSGVAGGGAAVSNQDTTTKNNNARTAATTAQMAAALESVYSTISSNAMTLANAAAANAEDAIKNQQTVMANAITAAQTIGGVGINASMYQTQDPTGWQSLLTQTGYTPLQLATVINKALPAQYQPSSQTIPMQSADGKGTTITVVTSQINPATGQVQQTQSSYDLAVPFAQFNAKNMITAADGTPIYINAQGQAINAETGQPYIPATVVPAGSTVVNTQAPGGADNGGGGSAPAGGGDTSWIPSGFTTGTSTSTQANNNPGAIMAANGTVPQWATAIDPNATVGSNGQVQFSTPALGIQAMQANLNSSAYSNLTLDKALQQWTGETGYGANSTTTSALLKQFGLDPNAKVSDIMKTNPTALTNAIMQGEGSIAPGAGGSNNGVSPLITGNNVSWNVLGIDSKGAQQLQSLNYTPQAIYQMAFQSIISGTAPSGGSMGAVGSIIKGGLATVQNSILKAYGLSQSDIPAIQAVNSGTDEALGSMIQQKASITQYITKTNANLGTLQSVIAKYGTTGSPLVNEALQAIQSNVTGDPKLTGLKDALTPFLNEYSKVMQGSTGSVSGATVNSQQEAADLLSTLMNKGQLQEGIGVMVQDMAGQINSVNGSVSNLTQEAENIIGQYATSKGSQNIPQESFAPQTFTLGPKTYTEGDAVPISNNGQTSLYILDAQGNLTPMQ